ncbi:cell division protein ZapE [Microbacterium amylolyticum]|uniref:Cell division protein ZapE n=1 Tax=Microbacterium amylolyticum TaxID=936337 RepID=A0ABS4ZEP4_9MICO|nr:cell division protein ZapE [Microbacterium amylolyticum]MBP2435498.1 cell division protein ZapE [Microbacterium amylolyticum]
MTPVTATTVRLVERFPQLTGEEMLSSLVPPPQFDHATFDTYRVDDSYPSQGEAKDALAQFAVGAQPIAARGLFSFGRKKQRIDAPVKPGVYLDGGFGVGKTHLLAAIYHAVPAQRKLFGSFIEYTALVGALGYKNTVDLLRGTALVCVDEFELDDPGDTMVMTRLLGELVSTGTRLAATSNTPPNALGEGRFAAQDFLREIQGMADSFRTIRIDGVDFRQRSLDSGASVEDEGDFDAALATSAGGGTASDDDFRELIAHLAHVHPSRYIRLIDQIRAVGLREVTLLTDQSEALRFVAFVDRVYDAQLPIRATGTPLNEVFSEEMLRGGYRKKYLRAISRLVASTHA